MSNSRKMAKSDCQQLTCLRVRHFVFYSIIVYPLWVHSVWFEMTLYECYMQITFYIRMYMYNNFYKWNTCFLLMLIFKHCVDNIYCYFRECEAGATEAGGPGGPWPLHLFDVIQKINSFNCKLIVKDTTQCCWMFNMMKNSAPNRFILSLHFQKNSNSWGDISPIRHPLRRASATADPVAPVLISANVPFSTSTIWSPLTLKIVPPPLLRGHSCNMIHMHIWCNSVHL